MLKLFIFIALTISFGDCLSWRSWTTGDYNIPSGAFQGGHYDNIHKYYVIRADIGGGQIPGKYAPNEHFATVADWGTEIYVTDIKVRK